MIPKNYPLYESSYGSDLPFHQLYVILFNELPSKWVVKNDYDYQIIEHFKELGFHPIIKNNVHKKFSVTLQELTSIHNGTTSNNEIIYINKEKEILLKCNVRKNDENVSVTTEVLYNLKNGELTDQINFDVLKIWEKKKKKSDINLIKSDMGHLDLEEFELNVPEIDLELNYGGDFKKIHELIIKRLNTKNDKGIILLHGDPGTGKTSYIKYLTRLIEDKQILFIPPSMAETLSEPSIIPFLMDHKNSVLIIEDAERVISDRETNGSSAGVSNILNLTDGILGDCLNIQIIATFNMKREKIDTALLRKGRLIAEHKFKNLSVSDTNKLLKHLNKNFVSETEMSLADIYNIDVEHYKTTDKTNKIGF
jgi:ATP-dependent 26S proteasome regulatory subunit